MFPLFPMLEELLSVGVVVAVISGAILFAVGFGFGTVNIQNAKLKCFHCGRETRVGRKNCESCGEELQ
jgi:rRNA maturation endonuclease Nob1